MASDPASVLAGYSLTPEEQTAVLSGTPGSVIALGVDTRVSKIDNPAMPGDAFGQGPFDLPYGS